MSLQTTTLANGIKVLSDPMPDVRSVALGLWFNVGSRDEREDQLGLAHFMEHMMFKGTKTRSAFDISSQFDALGAELNAFTSKEYTCYYARFVDENLSRGLDILSDMVINSQFTQETIDPEREVVLEEIARSQDAPDDYVFTVFSEMIMPDHPLGRPILGTQELVGAYTHDDCIAFHHEHYITGNLTVVCAGNVDHDELVALCEKYFKDMPEGPRSERALNAPATPQEIKAVKRSTEQAHVVYGMPWIDVFDDQKYASVVLLSALGGSMSSRLFQEVREKRGLVYAIFADAALHQGAGALSIYAGTRPENIKEVISIIRKELALIAAEGLTDEELKRTKDSITGQLLLSLESTNSRMVRTGKQFTLGTPSLKIDELVTRYASVTHEDIKALAQAYLTHTPTISVISPWESTEVEEVIKEALHD